LQDPLQPLPSFRCFRCIKYRVLDKQQIGFEEDVRDRAKHEKKQAAVLAALSSGYAGPTSEIRPVLGALGYALGAVEGV
jgi:hypothetical protein